MSLEINWCAPMYGDSAYVGVSEPEFLPTVPYFVELFKTTEKFGFFSLLMGAGFTQKMEAWTTAAAVLAQTQKIRALVATRPGFFHPCILGKMAATVDQISQGRVLINVVTGGNPQDLAMYGDFLDHDTRYKRTEEFIQILRSLWTADASISHEGKFFKFDQALLDFKPVQSSGPPIYFGGASEAAKEVAAKQANVYLMWGETLAQIKARIEEMRAKAVCYGRTLRYGLRINVIARSTEAAAWDAAQEMISRAKPDVVKSLSTWYATMDSVGQSRILELSNRGEVVEPHLWTGLSKVRVGAGTAIVGNYHQVVERLLCYAEAGIDTFILAGYPHLEEAERVGEYILPLLKHRVSN